MNGLSQLPAVHGISKGHLLTFVLDVSLERVNPHLEGPLSPDCMQSSENAGSNKKSNLKSKVKRSFSKICHGERLR